MRWQRGGAVYTFLTQFISLIRRTQHNTSCNIKASFVLGVLLAVVIGVGLGLLIGALLFTVLLLKNKYVMLLDILL